eukprot:GHVU01157428.1.p1 GENE.GHVU01157428.1~~GHVU01157428.1.p1  ORF type:complete len:520 (+),score=34.80 GHVU01157428.1:92-1651(+)
MHALLPQSMLSMLTTSPYFAGIRLYLRSPKRSDSRKLPRAKYGPATKYTGVKADEWKALEGPKWIRESGGAATSRFVYYRCRLHVDCNAKIRIESVSDGIQVCEADNLPHKERPEYRKNAGVPAALRVLVQQYLGTGMGPFGIKTNVNEEARRIQYTGPLVLTPQIRNYLRNLSARLRKHSPIRTHAELREWAELLQDSTQGDKWATLGGDVMFVPPEGVFSDVQCPCVAVTTKGHLENAVAATKREGGFGISIDMTWKVHRGGWGVQVLGTDQLIKKGNDFVHKFLPIALAFAKSESISAYRVLLLSVKAALIHFYGIDFKPATCVFDHSEAASTAAISEFPEITTLSDYPHAVRAARRHKVEDQIRTLRRCSDPTQFAGMRDAIVNAMDKAGCFTDVQLKCVRDTYGSATWNRFYVGASGIPGIVSNTNGHERYNRTLKTQYMAGQIRLGTELLLLDKFPRALRLDSQARGGNTTVQLAPTKPTAAMVYRAHSALKNKKWYILTGESPQSVCRCHRY